MKKVILFFAAALCSVLMMAQTNQVTWVNGRAVLGQSISSIDSIKYGTIVKSQKLELWLPETIVVHDTVIVHDTVYVSTGDKAPEGVEMVDLGLPSGIKWANMNVGATSITDFGCYFAWGETNPKEKYGSSTYKYYKDSTFIDKDGFETTIYGYTKYVRREDAESDGFDGFYDDKTTLDPEDDAAHVNWGGNWRLPTEAEVQELKANCTWKWSILNGINGYKVIGKNSNWIFLPAAGGKFSTLLSVGSEGIYLSSSLKEDNSSNSCYLNFTSNDVVWYSYCGRGAGQSVRPVCK